MKFLKVFLIIIIMCISFLFLGAKEVKSIEMMKEMENAEQL
jgi:hypothetical protein